MKNFVRTFIFAVCVLCAHIAQAQQEKDSTVPPQTRVIGKKYLEDQLYISLTYNVLTSTPEKMNTYSFSNAFSLGYIRDIPLNKRRNIGLGIGLGVSFHTYYSNLGITQADDGVWNIAFMDKANYRNNRLSTQQLDIPIQLRFRGSTADKFKFWRVYAGVTPSWVFKNLSTINDNTRKLRYYNSPFINNWIWYANIQAGYGKFNIKIDYSLNSIFDKKSTAASTEDLSSAKTINIGLLVYLL